MSKPPYKKLEQKVNFLKKKNKELQLQQLCSLYSQSPIPTLISSKEGKFIEYNEAMFELTGYTKEKVPDIESWMTRLYPDEENRRKAIEISRKSRRSEIDVKRDEFIITRKDGEKRYVEFSFYNIIHEGRSTDLQVIQGVDITKRKRAEEKICQQNEFLENIIESFTHPFCIVDTNDYMIIMANSAAKLGNLSENSTCYALTHKRNKPCDCIEHPCPIEKIKKTKKHEIVEHIHYDKDGNSEFFEIHGYPIFDDEGNITRIIEYSLDITESKRALVVLRESEEKYRRLFENLHDAAFFIDAKTGMILETNNQAEILLGSPRGEIIGMHQTELHPSDNVEKYKQIYRSSITSKNYKDSDAEVIRRDGMTIPISISCQKLTLGVKDLVICLYRDITDRKRMIEEEKLRQQQLIQTDKLASLGEVVAGIAHEINNQNSFITYNVPLLEETWQMFEPVLKEYSTVHPEWKRNNIGFEEFIQDMNEIIYSIKCGSERINEIVANLKDFARLDDTGYTKLVDINEIIKKTMIIVGAQVRKSVGHININLADNLPKIPGHFQKLEQVVANLVINSVHAIPNIEEGKLSISTRYIDRLRSILVEIEDNGEGIEPDLLNRIFEPFFTNRRSEGGTGLGLSVSYRIVKEHNGTISLLSKPGVGTRFTVYLPVERDVKLRLQPLILCVDDDETVLNVFKKYFLRIENMFLDSTSKSETVLEYIDEHPEVDISI